MITHKFREVMAFADDGDGAAPRAPGRRGRASPTSRPRRMAEMMVGTREIPQSTRLATNGWRPGAAPRLRRRRPGGRGRRRAAGACDGLSLAVRARRDRRHRRRSGNGQRGAGRGARRPAPAGRRARSRVGRPSPIARPATRSASTAAFSLPEEPLRNACVPRDERGREHGAAELRPAAARASGRGSAAARSREQADALDRRRSR